MITAVRLAWLVARPARTGAALLLLPLVAFTVVTALLLVVLGGAQSFWRTSSEYGAVYPFLAAVALSLLVPSLTALGGAAARLAARRRDDRLATLRLLGAGTRTVASVAVLEAVAVALAGALLGVVAALIASPLIARIPFQGTELTTSSVILAPGWTLLTVLAMVLVAALSAITALRRVNLSPLGVRMRSEAPRTPKLLVVCALAVLLIVVAGMGSVLNLGFVYGAVVAVALLAGAYAAAIGVVNAVGPWGLRRIAAIRLRRANSAAALLAVRQILDAPREAWRAVSGVAMTSMTAVVAGSAAALLRGAGTAGLEASERALIHDVVVGVVLTVAISFLMAACSIGVNQAASVLDRAEVNLGLHRLGIDVATLDGARRAAVRLPLLVAAIGGALVSGLLTFPLVGIAVVLAPTTLLAVLGTVAAGVVLVALSLWLTRPLLAATVRPPGPAAPRRG